MITLAGNQTAAQGLPAKIDELLSKAVRPNDPGLAIVVKKGPDIVFKKGYGVREIAKPGKIDPATNFRLASVTKQFTAMAIMLLIHDGKLHYEDHLTDIWPDFPAYGKQITVRQLLTHTSGLRDYENLMEAEEKARGPLWSADHQIQDAEVLALLKSQTSGAFAAGAKWEYSNSGYVVLGLVVAKVSGMPFGEFLHKRIFLPLGMAHTLVYENGKNTVANRAFGHTKEGAVFRLTDQSATSATLGDGGSYSNVQDLAKWDEGLRKHTLLSEKEMLPAWTSAKMADGSEYFWPRNATDEKQTPPVAIGYGFGWFLDPYKGHPRQYHDGESIGFRTTIQRFADENLTIIILCNRDDLSPQGLAEQVADLIFVEKNM
jgi:CubicO group peptidase (beta-lactamase class C family)